MEKIAGIPNIGRERIGINPRKYKSKVSNMEKRSLIVQKVREREEESRKLKIANLSKQGMCFKWKVAGRKINIWETTEARLTFFIKAIYDLLPTPQNKNVWFKTEEYKCLLCNGRGTINHIWQAPK